MPNCARKRQEDEDTMTMIFYAEDDDDGNAVDNICSILRTTIMQLLIDGVPFWSRVCFCCEG